MPLTILVVDDDPDVRESLVDVLETQGYRVLAAGNGLEALRLLRDQPRPHLILLDLMMPVMDGWTFLAEQRKRPELSAIPVIVITAYGVPPGAWVGEFMRKPIEISDLLRTVERLTARPSVSPVPM